jgi:hypothetical protein
VFNEEVLLAICFISFVYFIYSISNESVSNDFEMQTKKLILDLLQALKRKLDTELLFLNNSIDRIQ